LVVFHSKFKLTFGKFLTAPFRFPALSPIPFSTHSNVSAPTHSLSPNRLAELTHLPDSFLAAHGEPDLIGQQATEGLYCPWRSRRRERLAHSLGRIACHRRRWRPGPISVAFFLFKFSNYAFVI
jgi:hypothetical protein